MQSYETIIYAILAQVLTISNIPYFAFRKLNFYDNIINTIITRRKIRNIYNCQQKKNGIKLNCFNTR